MKRSANHWLEKLSAERRLELEICHKTAARFGKRDLPSDLRPDLLAHAGWGILFSPQDADLLSGPLASLLERRKQAANPFYREIEWDEALLVQQHLWLELGANPGQVDPDRLPYYLLILGGPEKISWRSQSLLGLERAIGRVAFEHAHEYQTWAETLIEAEDQGTDRPRRIVSFAPSNGDRATRDLRQYLVDPLIDQAKNGRLSQDVELDVWDDTLAHKEHLARLLGGDKTPGVLLAACHGKGFSVEDPLLRERQGALIGQGWQTNESPHSREDDYFAACDLPERPELRGLVAFLLACWGLGTPEKDDFAWVKGSQEHSVGEPFVAKLPQALLSRGALAVVGSVDRGWVHSVRWLAGGETGENSGALRDSIKRFLDGQPLGHALQPVRRRYAKLAAWILDPEERLKDGETVSEQVLEALWIAHNAARNFLLLGDPYTRLPSPRIVGSDLESAGTWNPIIPKDSAPRARISSPVFQRAPGTSTVTIWVRENRSNHSVDLEFQLEGENASLPPIDQPLKVTLEGDPEAILAPNFRKIEDSPPNQHTGLLQGIGASLSRQLLPYELQSYLWKHQASLNALWIRGHADWIPWELLRLRDPKQGTTTLALAEAFSLIRWPGLPGESEFLRPANQISLRNIALIAPDDSDLEAVDQEREFLHQLSKHTIKVTNLTPSFDCIREAAEARRFGLWHFAGHGGASGFLITHRHLQLNGGAQLSAADIEGLDTASWRKDRPLVFLNACHSGLTGRTLAGPREGLAHAFLRAGAGAVVGAQWAIGDEEALRFTETFYETLLENQSIGMAVFLARRRLTSRSSGHFALAYVLYADPEARLADRSTSLVRPAKRQVVSRNLQRRILAAAFLSAGLLTSLYRPATPVELDLLVRQADLTVSASEAQSIIDHPLPLDYLTVKRFGQLRLLSQPGSNPSLEEQSASGQWKGLEVPTQLTALEPHSQGSLELLQGSTTLGPLRSRAGATVQLRADQEGEQTVLRIELSPEATTHLITPDSFTLWADLVAPKDPAEQPEPTSRILRQNQTERMLFEISPGIEGSLRFLASLLSGADEMQDKDLVLLDQPLDIESIELFEPSLEGHPTSSIVGPGGIEIPGRPLFHVDSSDAIALEKLRDFKILRMALEDGAIRMVLQGQAGLVQAGPEGATQDLRPSLDERILPSIPKAGLSLGFLIALAILGVPVPLWVFRKL